MAKKTLGYTKLIWTCPNCKIRNPGPIKTCGSCGSPQPKDVHFETASQADLLKEEEEIRKAKAGADIHCPYCGTRNPADSASCSQCQGDLREGVKRSSGQVVGAFGRKPAQPLLCAACGAENEADSGKCVKCGSPLKSTAPRPAAPGSKAMPKSTQVVLAVLVLALVAGMCALVSRAFRRDSLSATVRDISWQREVQLEQFQVVEREGWWDEIPAGAEVSYCEEHYRYNSAEAVANSIEVCGTPYTIDQGSGYAEVVQECEYQIFEDYCAYTVGDWVVLDTYETSGRGLQANWPSTTANSDQREGQRSESYVIEFQTDDGLKRYVTKDYNEFLSFSPGSRWELKLDGYGNIVGVSR